MDLTFLFEETAIRDVSRYEDILNSDAAKQAAGRGVRRLVVDHLNALPPNKAGFPTTGFYQDAAESTTQPEVEGAGVYVSITQIGMRQRYLGGDIVPPWKNGSPSKYLAIPAQGFGYGVRARSFDGLKFLWGRDKDGQVRPIALIASDDVRNPNSRKRTRTGAPAKIKVDPDSIVYWLVKSVHQEPDPSVVPTDEEIAEAAADGLRNYLQARLPDYQEGQ